MLAEASADAEMICVGFLGIGRFASSILGSTATELAVVRMTEAPDNDVVVKYAVGEAKLRRAPMLVLGGRPEDLTEDGDGEFERRVQELRRRHPEVRGYPITSMDEIASLPERQRRASSARGYQR